jgi:hypothetical protein
MRSCARETDLINASIRRLGVQLPAHSPGMSPRITVNVPEDGANLADWLMVGGGLMAALAALVLSYLAFRQMKASREQAEAASEQVDLMRAEAEAVRMRRTEEDEAVRQQIAAVAEIASEAKQLREDQTRPFVVIELDGVRKTFFEFVIKNIGTTMARNVTFTFDPPAESTMSGVDLQKLKMFRDGISTLPPGKVLRTLFDDAPARYKAQLPDVYEVTVSYLGPSGPKRYEEKIDLDFGLYWNSRSITTHDIHDLHKQLEGIRKEVGKWTAKYGDGLLHVTPADVQDRIANLERQLEERRARNEQSD